MAPEQAAGKAKEVGPATDVWALGVILYQLLTGHTPFRGDSTVETFEQVRTIEPVPPRRSCPQLPRDVETICLKCLTKAPGGRYVSAAALADDLERWVRGEPILARPIGWIGRLGRWCRRNPRVAALYGVVVALFAAAVGLGVAAVDNLLEARTQSGRVAARKKSGG